ncbi:unnamed protein product [Gadus morhua 'NCC']
MLVFSHCSHSAAQIQQANVSTVETSPGASPPLLPTALILRSSPQQTNVSTVESSPGDNPPLLSTALILRSSPPYLEVCPPAAHLPERGLLLAMEGTGDRPLERPTYRERGYIEAI